MNKIDLLEMDAADMVDVIHYFFDEDFRYGSIESAHLHGKFRQYVYKDMYEQEYRYAIKADDGSEIKVSDDGTEIKPFIPPTEFDGDTGLPMTNLLDAPLG